MRLKNHPGTVLPIAVMAFAIVAFLFVMWWAVTPNQTWPWSTPTNTNQHVVACTQEAKQCPDGSYVGRTGPNCSFAACPTVNKNTTNTNASKTEVVYPTGAASQYSTSANVTSSYYFGVSNLDKKIITPFKLDEYHATVTTYGILFWKKGETKTTRFDSFGDQDIPYETGVVPDFRWYDFRIKTFVTLPTLTWKTGSTNFERVFSIHVSTTEPLVVIEIGLYDIHSSAFEPGLIDSQPVSTRGVVYDPVSNTFLTTDPLGVYLKALGSSTTQWQGFTWDSKLNMAASVPGGEGCGPAPSMTFVNTITGELTRINDLRQTIGWGGYDYTEDQCNPHNGRSPDGHWFVLYGKNKSGTMSFRLFQFATLNTAIKTKLVPLIEPDDGLKTWDLSGTFPKIITSKGKVIDFNT